MNSGDVFSDSVRRSVVDELARDPRRLDVDVEQDFRVIADEADRHDQEPADVDASDRRSPARSSGPIHGSGVRPALWYAQS